MSGRGWGLARRSPALTPCFGHLAHGAGVQAGPRDSPCPAPPAAEANSLVSSETEIPYRYYRMPFCIPPGGVKRASSTVNPGTILLGIRINNSPYNFSVMVRPAGWRDRHDPSFGAPWARFGGAGCPHSRAPDAGRARALGMVADLPEHPSPLAPPPAGGVQGAAGVQGRGVPRRILHRPDRSGDQGGCWVVCVGYRLGRGWRCCGDLAMWASWRRLVGGRGLGPPRLGAGAAAEGVPVGPEPRTRRA